ncbi:MAG: hypothetical protein WCS37_16985 [Chloroflexota bacterium]
MAKKDKDKKKPPHHGQNSKVVPIQDLTAERYFTKQVTKAHKLGGEHKHEEALEILEDLKKNYSDRPMLFDLMGLNYMSLEDNDEAREAFIRALELMPLSERKQPGINNGQILLLKLATTHYLSGFPLLGYEFIQQVNLDGLAKLSKGAIEKEDGLEILQLCEEALTALAEEAGQSPQEFLPYGLLIERGGLALERSRPEEAQRYYKEARQLDSTQIEPYNGLAMVYLFEGKIDQSKAELDYILEQIAPNDPYTLNTLVQNLASWGRLAQACEYAGRLAALPLPEEPDEVVNLADSWAYLEEDQRVFDLVAPLLNSAQLEEVFDLEEDIETLTQALLLGVVAAAHLGQRELALKWINEVEEQDLLDDSDELLDYTRWALVDGEVGPKPGDRFFYHDPELLMATIMATDKPAQEALKAKYKGKKLDDELDNYYHQLMKEYPSLYLDFLLYKVWTGEGLEDLIIEVSLIADQEFKLEDQVVSGLETVKRLTFSRIGSPVLHLVALATLTRKGLIAKDEVVTIWSKEEQVTGTLTELAHLETLRQQDFQNDDYDDDDES